MKKVALYSARPRAPAASAIAQAPGRGTPHAAGANGSGAGSAGSQQDGAGRQTRAGGLRALLRRYDRAAVFVAGALFAGALILGRDALQSPPQALTQEDIDAAVLHTLQTKELPSRNAAAAEAIRPSVVRIKAYAPDEDDPEGALKENGVGSGVVIMEDGTLLTNLHVVAGAKKLVITFFDGSESEGKVTGAQPDNDLAVVKPSRIPDDLPPATLGSSRRIVPGDEVLAVGFPFGIGPSVSAGVVSGLNREFRSEEGRRALKGLIQFDAAANPGNSGGPLITQSGEVIGIVTAILNPTPARTFIGIGFAATIESAGSAMGLPPF